MGAVKPWHALILLMCCLLSTGLVTGGVVWAVIRSRRRR
jgi:hypothetical protein